MDSYEEKNVRRRRPITKPFEDYDMFEPAIAGEIVSMIRHCLVHQGLNDYKIMQGGDCLEDLVNIIKDFSNPRSRVLIFTEKKTDRGLEKYVRSYKPNIYANNVFSVNFISRPSTQFDIDANTNKVYNDEDVETNFNHIKNLLRSSIFCQITADYVPIKELPLRGRDIPYNLNKHQYGLLLRPHDKDRSIIVKYYRYRASQSNTINISANIRLNGYTGPQPDD